MVRMGAPLSRLLEIALYKFSKLMNELHNDNRRRCLINSCCCHQCFYVIASSLTASYLAKRRLFDGVTVSGFVTAAVLVAMATHLQQVECHCQVARCSELMGVTLALVCHPSIDPSFPFSIHFSSLRESVLRASVLPSLFWCFSSSSFL